MSNCFCYSINHAGWMRAKISSAELFKKVFSLLPRGKCLIKMMYGFCLFLPQLSIFLFSFFTHKSMY